MRTLLLSLALTLSSLVPASALAQGDPLPDRVLAAIEARWPGAVVLWADRDDGRYDVDICTARGRRLDLEITRTGRIVDVDDEGACDDDRWDDDDHWDDDHRRHRR